MYIYIDVVVANVEATARKYVEKGHFAAIKQKSSITLVFQTIWHTVGMCFPCENFHLADRVFSSR